MEDLLQVVRELKTKAKNRRDLGRYPAAIAILEEAVQALETELAGTTLAERRAQLAAELADCYGLLGGIHRRWGLSDSQKRASQLLESFNAYDKGYEMYEAHEEYKIAISYNRLNRLVSYLLFDPVSLDGPPAHLPNDQTLSVKAELEKAGDILRQQLLLERRGDIWALADLALVNLLLDRGTAASAYAEFIAASPPNYCYDSALSVLHSLAELELPMKAKLNEAVKLLEAKLQELR
jgi:tetratricopeptide (TPR) repeat protein